MLIYHGSNSEIRKPDLQYGRKSNDFGQGFYCFESAELAMEAACKLPLDGVANEYELDTDGLNIIDLNSGDYNVLNWMALLLANRVFALDQPLAVQSRNFFLERFGVDLSKADVVKGYRADDSYFSFAQALLNNAIPVRLLESALRLGELGTQVVIVSPKALAQLNFRAAYPVKAEMYHRKFVERDQKARSAYQASIKRGVIERDDVFIRDILFGGERK